MDRGNPISYLALEAGAEVVTSDGDVVGKVEHVLADADSDVFDGLVIDTKLGPGGARFVDADQVAEIYERAVILTLAAGEVDQLHEPTPAPATMEAHALDDSESPLMSKLHRAWDLISGNY
jgi:sporulation protein YlmC with PRC-barrel domain